MLSRTGCFVAIVLCACSFTVGASAEDAPKIVEQRAAPVIEASATSELPPYTAEETMPVLAVDKAAEPRPKPKKLWDIVKVLPMAFYTPETSLGLGAGALFLFDMPGAVATRRPSSVSIAGLYTLEHQLITQLVPELRFGDDDFVLRVELLGTKYPSRFYGIGNDPHYGFEQLRDWFKALYETLLGSSQGPRMGSFIALYGVENTRALIAEALAGDTGR